MEDRENIDFKTRKYPETISGYLSTNSFENICGETKNRVITGMGTQGIPEGLVKGEMNFKSFFEKEFFKLDEKGIKKLNDLIILARESFWGAFGGESKRFECSKKVEDVILRGFRSFSDVHDFFKLVGVEDSEGWEKFLNADLNTQKGHNRLSACKILKRTLALFVIEKPLLDLKERVSGLFSSEERKKSSDGFLKGLSPIPKNFIQNVKNKPDILSDFIKEEGTIEVLGKGEFVLSFGEKPIKGISRILLSLKSPEIAIEKLERNPKLRKVDVNDLVRMKFIFEDENAEENISDFLFDIHGYSNKENFSKKSLIDKAINNKISIESRNKNLLSGESVFLLKDVLGEGKLISHTNNNSGSSYKAVNNKIDFGDGFSFEIQAVSELGNIINENPNTASGHFPVELRRFADHVARLEGKMTKEELLIICDKFLKGYKERKIKTIRQLLDYYKPFNEKGDKRIYLKGISPQMKELIDGYHQIESSYKKHPEIVYPKNVYGGIDVQPGLNSRNMKSEYKVTAKKDFKMLFRNQKGVSRAQVLFDYLCLTGKISNVHPHYPKKTESFTHSKSFIGTALKKCHEELFSVLNKNKEKNKES